MEDWSVLGSGSDDEKADAVLLDFGGIQIPPTRVLDLMQSVQLKNTVALDSIGETYQQRKLKKKKKKKSKSSLRVGVGGARPLEDVSETTSEIRSTTCTSTSATECRDSRRPKFDPMFDDPELDDNGALSGFKALATRAKKAPPPSHRKDSQLARLDKITADEMKRRQRQRRWQKAQQELTKMDTSPSPTPFENTLHNNRHPIASNQLRPLDDSGPSPSSQHPNERGRVPDHEEEEMDIDNNMAKGGVGLMEDSDEDDSESDSDMKFPLLTQINKIEKLLDSDVS